MNSRLGSFPPARYSGRVKDFSGGKKQTLLAVYGGRENDKKKVANVVTLSHPANKPGRGRGSHGRPGTFFLSDSARRVGRCFSEVVSGKIRTEAQRGSAVTRRQSHAERHILSGLEDRPERKANIGGYMGSLEFRSSDRSYTTAHRRPASRSVFGARLQLGLSDVRVYGTAAHGSNYR